MNDFEKISIALIRHRNQLYGFEEIPITIP